MLTLIASLGLLSSNASAQDVAYNAHGFTLTPGTTSTRDLLTVWGTDHKEPFECGVEGLFEYASQPLILSTLSDGEWSSRDLLADMAGVNLGATCGLTHRVGAAVSAPLWFTTSSSEGREGFALGDTRISAPLGLLVPDDGGFGASVVPFVTLATATSPYLGTGGFGGGADLALGWTGERASLTANVGAERTPEVSFENLRGGTFVRAAVGGAVDLTEDVAIRVEGTLQSNLEKDVVPWTETPAQVLASLRGLTERDLMWTVGGAMAVSPGAGAADYRLFAGLGKTWGHEAPPPPRAITQLRIIALDPDGEPVDATVQFMDSPTPERPVELGDDGQAQLTVDPGDFKLHVSNGAYASKVVHEDVPMGELTTVTVQFQRPPIDLEPVCTGTLSLTSVHFDFNVAWPTDDSIPVLIEIGKALAKCPDVDIEVGGHTDAAGDAPYNWQLSQDRMNSVVTILASNPEVNASRLHPVGYGESDLAVEIPTAAACAVPDQAPEIVNDPEGRCAANRRVVFKRLPSSTVASSR